VNAGADCFWNAGHLAEQPIVRSFDFLRRLPVQVGTNPVSPFGPQIVPAPTENLQRTAHIEDVLRRVTYAWLSVEEQLLRKGDAGVKRH
jgi:hypothetical protein